MTRTFLIIDNQSYCFRAGEMHEAFAEAGVEAEFAVASHKRQALDILQRWQAQGLGLDVVTCDINAMNGNVGIDLLEALFDKVSEEIGNDMLPRQVFLHSANYRPSTVQTKYGISPCVFSDNEIMALTQEQGVFHNHGSHICDLRRFLNKEWGTRFVFSPVEEANLNNPSGLLEPYEAIELIGNGLASPADAFRRLQLESWAENQGGDQVVLPVGMGSEICELSFARTVAGTVAGVIAYNEGDIARLKKENPQEPVILVLESAKGYEQPPRGIEGLVVLKDDVFSIHLGQVCQNMGLPALIGALGELGGEYSLSAGAGLTFSQYSGARKSGNLPAGSGVTIAAFSTSGVLFPQKLETGEVQTNALEYLEPLLAEADEVLGRAGIQVKANCDTAGQVEEAIAAGAHGIGLVRTERLMMQDEIGRNVLKNLLSGKKPSARDLDQFYKIHALQLMELLMVSGSAGKDFPVTLRLIAATPPEFGANALHVPGLYETQLRALGDVWQDAKVKQPLQVLVPGICNDGEMGAVSAIFNRYVKGGRVTLAPMVENKSCLGMLAAMPDILHKAVSYGTNDLTSDYMGGVARNDIPAITAWMKVSGVNGKNPFISLMDPVREGILSLQNRSGAPTATICGQQVADDLASIRWAARNGLSLSVPVRQIPFVKIVAGRECLNLGQ